MTVTDWNNLPDVITTLNLVGAIHTSSQCPPLCVDHSFQLLVGFALTRFILPGLNSTAVQVRLLRVKCVAVDINVTHVTWECPRELLFINNFQC